MEPKDTAGGKPPEFWLIAFRDIVEKALDRHMCNIVKTATPETVAMSREQHSETMEKIDELVAALNVGLKAFYVLIAALVALGLIGLGTMMFAVSVLIAK